jgi:SEL1 protein
MGGDQLAQMAMGHRHLFGNGVPNSCQSAVLFYDPPAALFSDASFAQTTRFGSGPVTEKIRLSSEHTRSGSSHTRERDVAQYYQYSADMGNADAASAVGRLLTNGARGVPVDRLAAYKYFTQAAAAGDADAMSHLGHMWANGIGVGSPNNETGTYWAFPKSQHCLLPLCDSSSYESYEQYERLTLFFYTHQRLRCSTPPRRKETRAGFTVWCT